MDALRLQPDVPNIPYMHLFHDLKQKFPFLKDSEINESIQKHMVCELGADPENPESARYGLDRERCIAELSQRNAILPGGYYGPWGRGSSGSGFSSPALSRVASPLRGGTPTTPTTSILTTTSNMMPQLHNTTATHLVLHPQSFTPNRTGSAYTSPRIISSPTSYQPPMGHPYGWSSVVSNGPCRSDMQTASLASGSNQDTPFSSRDPSRSPTPAMSPSSCPSPTSTLPSSAPVMITNYDPFCDYKNFNNGTLHRRNSEETVYNKKQGLFYNIQNYEQVKRLSLSPVRSQCSPLSDVPDLSSPSSPTTATVTTTTTTAATAAESSGPRTTGQRHVSCINLIPTPPHGAHHSPGPRTEDGEVSVSARSYTSVNLQLRQPSSEPQSPIQIRGSGSSLTYSTSSLDHRLGARSSLQISIGPNGGTISAMRTNKDKSSPANTAFHIQYSSGANESTSPTAEVTPISEEKEVVKEGSISNSRRPQTWYVPDNQEVSEQRPRKSSLPECGELPLLKDFHYPPSTSELALEESASLAAQFPSTGPRWVGPPTSLEPDPIIVKAIVTEQSKRKQKLTEELNKSVEERNELESQVEKMKRDLEEREHQRKLNAETNAVRIEDVQLENQRLQSECDQMESEILRVAPLTDTEEYVDVGNTPVTTPVYEQPMSLPTSELPSHLTGGASGHIVNSTAGSPMTAHAPMIPGAGFTPTRPAPPPPQPTSCTNLHTQGVPRNEESERNWSCSKCTFINHPGLNKCEMCEFPRFNIGRASTNDMRVVDVPSLAGPQAASGAQPHSHQGPCYCHRSSHQTQAAMLTNPKNQKS